MPESIIGASQPVLQEKNDNRRPTIFGNMHWNREIPSLSQKVLQRSQSDIQYIQRLGSSHLQVHNQTGHQYASNLSQSFFSAIPANRLVRTVILGPSNAMPLNARYQVSTGANRYAGVSNTNAKEQMISAMRQAEAIQRDLDEEEGNFGHTDTYFEYRPSKLRCGLAHPDSVIESSSLSSVTLPDIHYVSRIPEYLVDTGALSALQYEALLYACQMHERILPSGERAGYLIGDGAGVGKGRTIAGLILENYKHDRKRSVWLSISNDLRYDAQRDLRDIGATNIEVYALNKFNYSKINSKENGNVKKGVIFGTYASLIGECKTGRKGNSSRIKQLVQWFGKSYDGLIIFDECHRAKNLVPGAGGRTTKTGRMVLELQKLLPNARIIYASATGATEPRNMAYMTRLGLWGYGRSFSNFNEFLEAVERRGIGAMEIVAVEMKQRGLYIARQLSFSGASFKVEELQLTDEYIKIYDDSVRLWAEVRRQFQNIISRIPLEQRATNKYLWSQFWGNHQRFFKYLCIAAKVNACVNLTRNAIAQGKCVVIGLQSTGEARTLEVVEEMGEELSEFVSTSKAVLQNLITSHFPGTEEDQDEFTRGFMQSNTRRRRSARLAGILDEPQDFTIDNARYAKRRRKTNGVSSPNSERDASTSDMESKDSELSDNSEVEDEYESEGDDDWVKMLLDEIDSSEESTQDNDNSRPVSPELACLTDKDYHQEMAILKGYLQEENSLDQMADDIPVKQFNPFVFDFSNCEEDPWADQQIGLGAYRKREEEMFLKREKLEEREKRNKKKQKKKHALEAKEKLRLEEVLRRRELALEDASKHSAEEFLRLGRIDEDEDLSSPSEIKTKLLLEVEALGSRLPPNTLDHLIDELGGPEFVAEMTGRKGRLVQKEDGSVAYELRHKNSDVPLEYINLEEKDKFMDGTKKIAIISEAASSGISLQSDRRAKNSLRRVHITLELPWSADKAIQQFGRTHRSNQVTAPEYVFLISELAGEKRFASIVAKRLESLGALTHGDRRATETQDLSQFNLDTKYGRQALECLLKSIIGVMKPPLIPPPNDYKPGDFFTDMATYLESVGILGRSIAGAYIIEKDGQQMIKFLNRILGIPVHAQSALFRYFSNILSELISHSKRDGTYDMGIMDLGMRGTEAKRLETRVFLGSREKGSFRVEMHKIAVERGVIWEDAQAILEGHKSKDDGFYMLRKHTCKRQVCVLAYEVDNKRSFVIIRPSTGRSSKMESFVDLTRKFVRTDTKVAEELWKAQYTESSQTCQHLYIWGRCRTEESGRFCESGRRMRTYFLLSGSILSIWPVIEAVFSASDSDRRSRQVQMIRVNIEQDQKIVGILILPIFVRSLVTELEKYSDQNFVAKIRR